MGEHRRIKPVADRLREREHVPVPFAHRPYLEFVLNRGYYGVVAREADADRDGEWIHCERLMEVRR